MPLTVITSGSDIKLDDLATPDDTTDLNATTGHHGLLPKLSGVSTEFLNGSGAFSTPAGSGGTLTLAEVLAEGADPANTPIAGANGGVGASGGSVQLAGGSANADESQGASLAVGGADEDAGGPVQVSGGNGGAGLRGGSLILTAGGGDSGNDPGASIVVGGGLGIGDPGTIEVTTGGQTFELHANASSLAPTFAAPVGSLLAAVPGQGSLWFKAGNVDTGWAKLAYSDGSPGVAGDQGQELAFEAGSGDGGTTGGAALTLQGGQIGPGGAVTLSAGFGAPGEAGGNATISGGQGDDGNDAGASITVGGGSGTGDPGAITVVGAVKASDGAAAAAGGQLNFRSGSGNAAADDGAALTLTGGSGDGTGGSAQFGAGGGSSNGGATFNVYGGDTDGGGGVTFGGGSGTTAKPGGAIELTAGTGDDGNDFGASITVGGGSGAGASGTIGITTGGLSFSILGGTADPSAGGGVAANVASLYARDNSSTGELWVKTGAADTAWTKVV